MRRYRNLFFALLSCIVVFTVQCRFELCGGGFEESNLLNGLNKAIGAFNAPNFADLLIFAAVMIMLRTVAARDRELNMGTMIFSLVLAVLFVVCISFMKFNSAVFLLDNSFQLLLSLFCIAGLGILFYLTLRLLCHAVEKEPPVRNATVGETFYEKKFRWIGGLMILAGWLFWILLNYPGTSCPDSISQLKQFLGEMEWGAAHPPLSSAVMGVLFTIGRSLVNANFGYFLYCFFQACVGAWTFSLCMEKLRRLGVSVRWCTVGILFFAFTPFWGTYAQWFEKDLLYAEVATLQAVYLLEVVRTRCCDAKNAVLLALFSILSALLRNNGIYAVVPALLLLVFWLKGVERRKAIGVLAATVVAFEGITMGIYGMLGIGKPSAAEAYGLLFQQTARYVCEYGDEVTEQEREVINSVLHYEALVNYDPVLTDPVKVHYNGSDLTEYTKVWFSMFWKHPGCYVAAFINKGYGYLAPVEPNIEAWIQVQYPEYIQQLGIYHPFGLNPTYFLAQIWNLSMTLPLVKYLCTPGLYTWILLVLAFLLIRRRKIGALIMLVPSAMNVLVCLASPMANAIRYELPTVAVIPLLIGWTCYSLRGSHPEPGKAS